MRVQPVAHAPVEESRKLFGRSQVVVIVGWGLQHPVDISLLRPPLGWNFLQLDCSLVEHDGVKLGNRTQVVPVGGKETSRLRTALASEMYFFLTSQSVDISGQILPELFFTKLPAVLERAIALTPSEDVFSS